MKPGIASLLGVAVGTQLLACGWWAAHERELDRPFALAPVDEVEVRLLGARRWTGSIVVRGRLPDTCTRLDRVRRHRIGRVFEFTLTTVRDPADGCSQEPRSFEKSISLYLDPVDYGQYRAIVNGVSRTFYVSSDPLHREGVTGFETDPIVD